MATYITPIEAYRLDRSIRLHFASDKYNMFKSGMVKIKGPTFDKRHDTLSYTYISSKLEGKDVLYYFLGNTLAGNFNSVHNCKEEGAVNHKDYRRKLESISHIFFDELTSATYEIDNHLQLYTPANGCPPLIEQYIRGGIFSLETVCLIQLHCFDIFSIDYSDYMWDNTKKYIEKYLWFFKNNYIKYDAENILPKYKKLFDI